MRLVSILSAAALTCAAFTSGLQAQGRTAGSLLIYPVHRSGDGFFTVASVVNTNLTPMTKISFGGSTNAHFVYVNVVRNILNPFRPLACNVFDRVEFLTPADSLSVLTGCHNATFGRQEGYLVVTAEDPTKYRTAWSHNWLMGYELVVSGSGVAYSIEAIPFQSPIAAGSPTDKNMNMRADLDGQEYSEVPDQLYIDNFVALAGSQLTLINLTGGPLDINTVYFAVWNDNEYPLSATIEFNCWFDERLTNISTLFSDAFLSGLPNDPIDLDVNCNNRNDLETGWAIVDSIDVRVPGGQSFSSDGAMLGAITAGATTAIDGGRLLAESKTTQSNGSVGH